MLCTIAIFLISSLAVLATLVAYGQSRRSIKFRKAAHGYRQAWLNLVGETTDDGTTTEARQTFPD